MEQKIFIEINMPARSIALPRLPFSKIIRDRIHGYIQLTPIEYKLIQLPALNRLHNIKQLSTAYMVYPCAKGSRFEHSLGVMHIASRMINQILCSASPEELKELFDLNVRAPTKLRVGYCDLVQKVRLAALLHDVGHGPFSHLSEEILHKAIDRDEVKEATELFCCKEEKISFHEYFSYKMITSNSSIIKEIIEKSTKIKAIDVGNLLIGRKSKSISDEGTGIVKKLISSQLDADRMDYLLRDADSTGVIFGLLDIDRVIMNLRLRKDKTEKYEIAVHERAFMSIEDMIDARFKMYKWVYNHHLIVALNRLVLNALESMIENKQLSQEEFHWNAFLQGKTDENYVHTKLIEYQNSEFKGLIDRQYAPTSLLKRPGDYYNFATMIEKEMGRKLTEAAIKSKIVKCFSKIQKGKLDVTIPDDQPEELEKTILLAIQMPRSPYKALNGKESIWICTDRDEDLKELTTESPYVEAINREWQKFPSFYLSFLIPNMEKEKTKKYKEKVLEIVAREITLI